jgi:hypothetical protein
MTLRVHQSQVANQPLVLVLGLPVVGSALAPEPSSETNPVLDLAPESATNPSVEVTAQRSWTDRLEAHVPSVLRVNLPKKVVGRAWVAQGGFPSEAAAGVLVGTLGGPNLLVSRYQFPSFQDVVITQKKLSETRSRARPPERRLRINCSNHR